MLATHRTTRAAALVLSASSLTLTALMASPAIASGDDDAAHRSGSCSGSTSWKIKAKSDDGRIEVEAEIDSNKSGQTWSWKLKDNGTVVKQGQSVTRGASGSFSVERKPANLSGTDHFVFRAVNPKSGEACRATVAW